MKQKKLVSSELVLRHYDYDLTKVWFWEWYNEKGKRTKKYGLINSGTTKEKRLEIAEVLRVRILTGLCSTPKPTTSVIYQHLEPHFKRHCEPLRPASKRDYTTLLTIFERWLLANGYKQMHPKKFGGIDAEKFCRFIEIEKKLENATYNKYLNFLDMLFDYLVQTEIITKCPFQYLKRKPKNSISVTAFKEDAVQELKEVLRNENFMLYVACMMDMYAFIRPGEIRNLKVGDIDLENGKIYIDKSISKNKKSQSVAIVPPLKTILEEYIGNCIEKDDYLLSKSGKAGKVQISSKYILEQHTRILKRLGYDTTKFKPYSWKHTGNSLAYKNGASLRFLKLQNRHHSEVMTEIYIKSIVPEDLISTQEQFFNF